MIKVDKVSIPVWFDWEKKLGGKLIEGDIAFQFQYGSIGSRGLSP